MQRCAVVTFRASDRPGPKGGGGSRPV